MSGGGDDEVKPTPQERMTAETGWQDWEFYKEKLMPVDKRYAEIVGDTDYRKDLERGEIAGRVGGAFEKEVPGVVKAMAGSGRGQGNITSALAEFGLGKGKAATEALTQDTASRRQEELEERKRLFAVGRGVQGQAMTGITAQGRMETARNIADAEMSQRSNQAWGQAAGAAVGLIGPSVYKKVEG